jgi:SsrA-binding protein
MHVAQYFYGSYNNHEAKRDRKLLLTRKELRKLASDSKNPGYTIVPTRLFIGDKGLAKLVIALAKGKHEFDKRQSIKDNEDKKAIARAFLV